LVKTLSTKEVNPLRVSWFQAMNSSITQAVIDSFKTEFETALTQAQSLDELELVRINFIGRKGKLGSVMGQLKVADLETKKTFGPILNTLKQSMQQAFNDRKDNLAQLARDSQDNQERFFDVTAYKPSAHHRGGLHPYTHVTNQIQNIFLSMGYQILDGPEVEDESINFEGLNIPKDHPARDMHDTFWLNLPGKLLRTHTSNIQVHTLKNRKPPFAVVAPGRCYRHEATDASHDYVFMQTEGFVVDKNISMAHLLETARKFLNALFGRKDLTVRLRPGYFPFVEPGVEIDIRCPFCTKGCSVCKKTCWIETAGAGLIHPNVLRYAGIDPDEYSGFAFGFGLSRLAILKYHIDDIRLLHTGKMEFLSQFG